MELLILMLYLLTATCCATVLLFPNLHRYAKHVISTLLCRITLNIPHTVPRAEVHMSLKACRVYFRDEYNNLRSIYLPYDAFELHKKCTAKFKWFDDLDVSPPPHFPLLVYAHDLDATEIEEEIHSE